MADSKWMEMARSPIQSPLKILLAKMESGCASTLPRHQKMIHLTLIEMLQLLTTQTTADGMMMQLRNRLVDKLA